MGFKKLEIDGIVCPYTCHLTKVTITPGDDSPSVILYNNTESTGDVVFEATIDRSVSDETKVFEFPTYIYCPNGIYADITGSNPVVYVYFT
jgi:hypothetical protein